MRTRRVQLSEKEGYMIKYIDDNQLLYFHLDKFASEKFGFSELQDIFSRLVKKQILFRIEKGLYCVRNFQNPFVIANAMQGDSIISFWSALNLHGLTEQIPNVVYSQSQFQKRDKTAFNVHYKFVKVKPEKMFGSMQMGYGSEVFRVTDVEKTLLDCFNKYLP